MKTPEQIADVIIGKSNWIDTDDAEIRDAMVAAIKADRAQFTTRPVLVIDTAIQLEACPPGSVVTSPLPDTESNVAERTSDGFWLVTGEDPLLTTQELFDWADDEFTVLRIGYGD